MKILFIGNRSNVLSYFIKECNEYDVEIFALKNSPLINYLNQENVKHYNIFTEEEKDKIINIVNAENYDLLISNGCPFILPLTKKTMINIHPTYLPYLRGKTPINGVLFYDLKFVGATMHYINNIIDGGSIIYQEKHPIGKDIDIGLVYYLSFYLEGIVFRKGWKILENNNFNFIGKKCHIEKGFYFNRTKDKYTINFSKMSSAEILRRVRSFGIEGQGAEVEDWDSEYNGMNLKRVYDAELIKNNLLKKIFKEAKPNTVLLKYDNKVLIKTVDGILKLTRFE